MDASPYATEVRLFGRWTFDDIEIKDISLEDYIAAKSNRAAFLPHSCGKVQNKRFKKAGILIVERLVNALMRYGRNNGKKARRAAGPACILAALTRDPRSPCVLAQLMAIRIVKHSFEIIHLLTDQACCQSPSPPVPARRAARLTRHHGVCPHRIPSRCSWRPCSTLARARIPPGWAAEAQSAGRPATCPPCGGSTRLFTCWPRARARRPSGTSRRLCVPRSRCGGARALARGLTRSAAQAECLADEITNAAKGSSNSYAIKKKDEIERVAKSNR